MCPQTDRWEITAEKTQIRERQHSKRTNNNSQYCRDKYTYRSRTWSEKELQFTELLDDECKRAKRCESYKVDLPKEIPKIGSDLVVVHKERYMRSNFDSFGKRGKPTLTTQLGRKFYWTEKKCFLTRHPSFWKGRLFIWRSVSFKLPGHFEYVKHGLHFDMTAALLEQWIW